MQINTEETLHDIGNRLNRIEGNIEVNSIKIEAINDALNSFRESLHTSQTCVREIETNVKGIENKVKTIESNGLLKLTENIQKVDVLKIIGALLAILLGSNIVTINLTQADSNNLNKEILESIKTLTE